MTAPSDVKNTKISEIASKSKVTYRSGALGYLSGYPLLTAKNNADGKKEKPLFYSQVPTGQCLQQTTTNGEVITGEPGYTAKPVAPEFYPGPNAELRFGEEMTLGCTVQFNDKNKFADYCKNNLIDGKTHSDVFLFESFLD